MISVEEFLMGRATPDELPPEYVSNMNELLPRVNALLEKFGESRKVNSGFRRQSDNDATANASKKSKHMICAAVDLEDRDGKLDEFCSEEILIEFNLYKEASEATPGWCHLSFLPPRSGKRIFIP